MLGIRPSVHKELALVFFSTFEPITLTPGAVMQHNGVPMLYNTASSSNGYGAGVQCGQRRKRLGPLTSGGGTGRRRAACPGPVIYGPGAKGPWGQGARA